MTTSVPFRVTPVDLCAITRDASRTRARISVRDDEGRMVEWITCGELTVRQSRDVATVGARYAAGVTDEEHDSSWAFSFDVIGLRWDAMMEGSVSYFSGWISTDGALAEFRVPVAAKMPTAMCPSCPEPHPVAPYMPDSNKPLWLAMRGRRIEIAVGYRPRSASDE